MKKILLAISITYFLSFTQAAELITLNPSNHLSSAQNQGALQQVARSSTPSLDVRYKVVDQGHGTSTTYVYILSKENNISLKGITANRGNCQLFRGEKGGVAEGANLPKFIKDMYGSKPIFPVHLKYGQETYFVFNNCPNLLEVKIESNLGSKTFKF